MTFKRLSDLDVAGKRVFIRADLNVPQDDAGNITDDTRIRASLPAIEMALKGGAAVMVTSHLGRPTEGEFKPDDTLAPIAKRMADYDYTSLRRLERTRILVRMGPALGLMGTLIPLSPALAGLADGNVTELTDNLRVAFGVTVAGLLTGPLAFAAPPIRDPPYAQAPAL